MATCQPRGGTELSAVEGGGGMSEGSEERHSASWRALLCAPGVPERCTPLLAGPGETAAGLGLGSGWVAGTGHGPASVHTRPWQAVGASAQDVKSRFHGCAMEEPKLLACFLFP